MFCLWLRERFSLFVLHCVSFLVLLCVPALSSPPSFLPDRIPVCRFSPFHQTIMMSIIIIIIISHSP
ncbi:hypothetical protein F5H01DRAFT_346243 [Linnemannia elongata]|nr:hypothetical protein F5H01DRAFT_346243 [Linnemannia elongata]